MKALVVVDMQNDFVTGALGTKEAVEILPRVLRRIEQGKAEGEDIVIVICVKVCCTHCVTDFHSWADTFVCQSILS